MGDDYVCSYCFDDYAIKQFIRDNAGETQCSYCGSQSRKPSSAFLGDVIKFIMQGILTEYGDPDREGIPYEFAEGGYQGEVFSTGELFDDEIAPIIKNDRLMWDIQNALHDKVWCQKDFYTLPPHRALIFNWEQFSNQVKHHTRYVFFRLRDELSNRLYDDPDYIPIPKMLDRLARVISETKLLKRLTENQTIWRVRVHDPDIVCADANSCGPPLAEDLKTFNRMSPAGISMFYGALDERTALIETRPRTKREQITTISQWRPARTLRFLDLTAIPPIPSLFDPDKREARPNIRFLWSFVHDITLPLKKKGLEHVDYVPTQVFTEYIRHLYNDKYGKAYDGILYPSCIKGGKINCVVFCDQSGCLDEKETEQKGTYSHQKHLKLVGHRSYICLSRNPCVPPPKGFRCVTILIKTISSSHYQPLPEVLEPDVCY